MRWLLTIFIFFFLSCGDDDDAIPVGPHSDMVGNWFVVGTTYEDSTATQITQFNFEMELLNNGTGMFIPGFTEGHKTFTWLYDETARTVEFIHPRVGNTQPKTPTKTVLLYQRDTMVWESWTESDSSYQYVWEMARR